MTDREHPARYERRDDGRRQAPSLAHRADARELVGRHDRKHAFLRLGRQDLERFHAALAQRNSVEVELSAHAGAGGRLAYRARDAGAAEVLEPLQQSALDHLE